MTKRYLGNIITQNPTAPAGSYEDDAASGVWSLAEAFAYSKAGLWPKAGNFFPSTALWAPAGGSTNRIDTMSFLSTGNTSDFGDLTSSRAGTATMASSTRGLFAGGSDPNQVAIDYVTITTSGNAADFGDMSFLNGAYSGGCSNSVRGLIGGGDEAFYYNNIQYLTIATLGNTLDFGDLSIAVKHPGGMASPTIGVFSGGRAYTSPAETAVMGSVTIASTGNASNFGNLTVARYQLASCSTSTRGVNGGGFTTTPSTYLNTIDYVTFSSLGSASDFGDLTVGRRQLGAASSSVYGAFGAGYTGSVNSNTIDYVTIASTGNASDWGDLTGGGQNLAGLSNQHGGLA